MYQAKNRSGAWLIRFLTRAKYAISNFPYISPFARTILLQLSVLFGCIDLFREADNFTLQQKCSEIDTSTKTGMYTLF